MEYKEVITDFLQLLSSKIASNQQASVGLSSSSTRLSSIINSLKTNLYNIKDFTINELLLLTGNDSRILDMEEKIAQCIAIANLRETRPTINFEKDVEEMFINELIDLLVEIDAKQIAEENSSKMRVISTYSKIYDKLRNVDEEKALITRDEIYLIGSLVRDIKDKDYIINLLKYINVLNYRKAYNLINGVKPRSSVNGGNKKSISPINVKIDTIDPFETLMNQYGYSVCEIKTRLPKIYEKFLGLAVTRVGTILDYFVNNSNYSFVKEFDNPNHTDSELVQDYNDLFLMFKYSDEDILNYLSENAKKRNLKLRDLITLGGILKHVSKNDSNDTPGGGGPGGDKNDQDYYGAFENYDANIKFLDMVRTNTGVDHFYVIWDKKKSILTCNPENFRKSYGVNIIYGLTNDLSEIAGTSFEVRTCVYVEKVDRIIERGYYDYINKYRSFVKYKELAIDNMCSRSVAGDIQFTTQGEMKDSSTLSGTNESDRRSRELVKFLDEFSNSHIKVLFQDINDYSDLHLYKVNLDDKYVAFMEQYINIDPSVQGKEYVYNINGVLISRNKFLRNWNIIQKNIGELSDYNIDDLFLYCILYNSYLSDMEYQNLLGVVKNIQTQIPRRV